MKKMIIAAILIFMFLLPSSVFAQQQTLQLKQGFNFISFTTKPDLTAPVFKQQFPAITEIYSYSPSSGSFISVSEGTLISLNAGKGYIVNSNSDASIIVSGTAVASVGNVSLKAGFNLVGISRTINAVKFSDLISNNSIIKGIYKWSAASGSFIQALRNSTGKADLPDGIDPSLSAAQSYFFNLDSDTTINYDNGSVSFGGGTAATTDEEAIRNLYAQYVTSIKNKSLSGILSCFSDNYRHMELGDGVIKTKTDIQTNFSKYVYASAEGTVWTVNSIKISGAAATTSVTCKTVLDGTVMENEIYTTDGMNYLIKENGKWLIIGNQKQWSLSGFTAHSPGKYFVELYLNDASAKATSAAISGPGVTSANASLIRGFYPWMPSRWAPDPMPEFGSSKPSSNLTYNFSINAAGTIYNETLDLGSEFIEEFPAMISPAVNSTTSSKPTFAWHPVDPVKIPNAVYHVEISNMDFSRIWDGPDSSAASATYTGILAPGSYRWLIVTKKQGSNNISLTDSFIFKVQ